MNLPQRPQQHVIADRAITVVKGALPREWIVREQTVDYGIDIEVELAGSVVSGRIFKGQVRGHEEIQWTRIGTYQQSVRPETYNYWREFALPVVLFVVDVNAYRAYWAPPPPALSSAGPPASITIAQRQVLPDTAKEPAWLVVNWIDTRQSRDLLYGILVLDRRHKELLSLQDLDFFLFLDPQELHEAQDVYEGFLRLNRVLGNPAGDLYPWSLWLARSKRMLGNLGPLCYGTFDEMLGYLSPVRDRLFAEARRLLNEEEATPHNALAKSWVDGFSTSWTFDNTFDDLSNASWKIVEQRLDEVGARRYSITEESPSIERTENKVRGPG